jgi:hypothetical protein
MDHPFAALKALRLDAKPSGSKKQPRTPGDGKGG